MVSKEDADLIISIICNDSEQLSKLSDKFDATFGSDKYLTILSSLSILLMDGILEPAQQIVVVWLIYKAFGTGSSQDNPFYDVLTYVFHNVSTNSPNFSPKMGDIIGSILSSNEIDELGEHSASEILEPTYTVESTTAGDLAGFSFPTVTRNSPIIITKADPKATQITQHQQLLKELLIESLFLEEFETPFMRTIPELIQPSKEELRFSTIMNANSLPFLLDEGQSINHKQAAKSLIKKAKTSKLDNWQEECLIEQVSQDHTIMSDITLSMDEINKMIATNPKVGGVMMAELARKDKTLFQKIADQDINEASCIMVKHIMTSMEPPNTFLDKYIINAVKILGNTKDTNVLKNKTKMLCDLILKLHEKHIKFSSKALIELDSLQVSLSGKGINEVQRLSVLFD